MAKIKVIVIAGPTACGKSDLGVELALKYDGEIISADSRQVYIGLDVGTGKITKKEMKGVPHYLLDVREPGGDYSAYEFKKDSIRLIKEIAGRGRLPIIVGGTGLYIEGLVRDYDFGGDVNGEQKDLDFLVINLNPERDDIKARIKKRLEQRWKNEGMLKEALDLIKAGVGKDWLSALGLEYRYLVKYIDGEFGNGEAAENLFLEKLNTESWRYAKRQITFIKRWEFAREVSKGLEAFSLVEGFIDKA